MASPTTIADWKDVEDGYVVDVTIRQTADEQYPSGCDYSLHLGTLGGDTILRYDNAHERSKGHERHAGDGVERIEFPGMGMGFLKRLLDEAIQHARERVVGGKPLIRYDQVKRRIAHIQAAYTACSAMCLHTSENANLDENLAGKALEANTIKSVVTDLMQNASQSLLQLTGGKGYRLDHVAGRSVVDSRPFQIFEGSNDVLYQQITESVLKSMRQAKETNLYEFLKSQDLSHRAVDYFEDTLDFEVDFSLPQRKMVDLGRILGRVLTMEMVIELGDRGFRSDLVANCLDAFRSRVDGMLTSYRDFSLPGAIEDYVDGSSWLDYVQPSTS